MDERIRKHFDYKHSEDEVITLIEKYNKAIKIFKSNFNTSEIKLFSVPGRTEITGNHTDHNGGLVLAGSINKKTFAVVSKNDDNKIRIISEGFDNIEIDIRSIDYDKNEEGSSNALIKGIINGFHSNNYKTGGFNAVVFSNIPIGAGLSSSASFEILISSILNHFYNSDKIKRSELAKISKFAENKYFGKPSGLMDQLSCSIGGIIKMDFKDEENPEFERINFNFAEAGYSIVLIDTGGSHANLTSLYASIPDDMSKVSSLFNKNKLAYVPKEDILGKIERVAEKTSYRAVLRALHFYEENERVDAVSKLMNNNSIKSILELIRRSGESSYKYLQNVLLENPNEQRLPFAIKSVENFFGNNEEFAVRVHGGGFDGTIQVFVGQKRLKEFIEYMEKYFCNFKAMPIEITSEGIIIS